MSNLLTVHLDLDEIDALGKIIEQWMDDQSSFDAGTLSLITTLHKATMAKQEELQITDDFGGH